MPFEVRHKKEASVSLAVDIDNDGNMVFELEGGTEIILSDKEVDSLIYELTRCFPWRWIEKLTAMLETWVTDRKEREKAERT